MTGRSSIQRLVGGNRAERSFHDLVVAVLRVLTLISSASSTESVAHTAETSSTLLFGAVLLSLSTVVVAFNAQLLRRIDLTPEVSGRSVLERPK